jgi:hypothetical protein
MQNKQHEQDHLIGLLREKIAVTISVTLAEIGFAPDDLGPPVKEILAGNDEIAFIVLGCGLDEARAKGNWEPVRKVVADIRKRQGKE